jgi:hypothetical protein
MPDMAGLTALGRAYGYRLYEAAAAGLWLLDLAVPVPAPGERAAIRTARALAPGYVDALRVIDGDESPLEQIAWLTASAVVARQLRQPVLGFLSDDDRLDFAAIVTPEGVQSIGDRLGRYLFRWEGGALTIQPFADRGSDRYELAAPEELSLIPSVTLLTVETLGDDGYPLHGNVAAEMTEFAQAADTLGIGTKRIGRSGTLALIEASGLEGGVWDAAAGLR